MILLVRIGSLEVALDDEQPGINGTPEQIEDLTHRLARQCVETYNALPDAPRQASED